MMERRGEKIGWVGGWLGGFLWIFLLGAIWTMQGKVFQGLAGLGLAVLAVSAILTTAPWRHPTTPYWRLLLPIYLLLAVCIAWAVWAWGGMREVGLTWWSLWWVIPMLIPMGTAGNRCWNDGREPSKNGNGYGCPDTDTTTEPSP